MGEEEAVEAAAGVHRHLHVGRVLPVSRMGGSEEVEGNVDGDGHTEDTWVVAYHMAGHRTDHSIHYWHSRASDRQMA